MAVVTVEKRKRKRGTAVLLSYLDNQGKRRREVIGTAATPEALRIVELDADRNRKRIEHELAEGKHAPKLGTEPLEVALLEFVKHQEASTVRESTLDAYKITFRRWRKFLKTQNVRLIKEVTPKLIVVYVGSLSDKAPDTVIADLTRLKRVFRHFVDRQVLASNPFSHPIVRDVWPQSVPHERSFTDAEYRTFTDLAAKPNLSPCRADFLDLFLLLAETGLRCGEALHLRWSDLSFGHEEGGYLKVQPWGDWKPKTRKSVRTIPLSPAVHEMLSCRLRAKGDVDPPALVFPPNWCVRHVSTYFNRLLDRAGLREQDEKGQKLRVHSLRHYFASRLVSSGVDPASARDLLGHSSITTTNRYFNVPRSELFGAVSKTFTRTQNVHDSGGVYRFPADVGQ